MWHKWNLLASVGSLFGWAPPLKSNWDDKRLETELDTGLNNETSSLPAAAVARELIVNPPVLAVHVGMRMRLIRCGGCGSLLLLLLPIEMTGLTSVIAVAAGLIVLPPTAWIGMTLIGVVVVVGGGVVSSIWTRFSVSRVRRETTGGDIVLTMGIIARVRLAMTCWRLCCCCCCCSAMVGRRGLGATMNLSIHHKSFNPNYCTSHNHHFLFVFVVFDPTLDPARIVCSATRREWATCTSRFVAACRSPLDTSWECGMSSCCWSCTRTHCVCKWTDRSVSRWIYSDARADLARTVLVDYLVFAFFCCITNKIIGNWIQYVIFLEE